MASFGGQQRRHDRNYQCPLLDSGGIFEAASKNSSQIMLETPPADVVETISRYFEAALGSSGQTKGTELCHPVTDNIDYSASDSGDSLFITQHPVTEVVRSVKRCHSKKRSKPIDREENGEEDGRSSHPRRHSGIKTFKKGEKYKLKKYSFPFLDKVDRSKCLSSRERAYRGTHLPFLKSVTLASSALGGFFKCVKALKVSKKKATLDLALPKRCLDEDDELPPLPEEEEQSEGSDEDDIRVVENYVFTPSVKEEHKQIWYQHRPRVKTPVSLVSKTSKNAKSNQTPARSWWRIPRKCNMTEEQLCTEVDRWVRSSRCRTDSEELDIDDDDTIVGGNVPQRKKSPSKKRAGNIHKHQEEELVEEDLLNARVVTSLTECELLTESQVLDIVGEGSRERMFMNLTGEIINSPYADVWEITGSCLENAQEVFEAQSVDHLSDHDDLHQTRKMEEELGIKQKHDTHPLRAPEVTKDCTDVEGQKNEHKGKKTKKKKRRKRDVECVDEGVGCGDDHNNIASSVNTGTIQRGEAARMSQNKITEHSVSQCEDVMMAPRKKRRKEKRRESSSHRDTGSKQHMKGRDSLTKNDTVEKNTDIDQITSALFQSEEVAVREKKKRKQEKILTTDTSEDLEARLEKNNVGVSPNTELDSNDTVIQSKKKKKRRKAEKETMVQHQEGDTEKLHETLKSSVSESSGVVSQRKKKKHKVKDRVLETPMGIEEYHEKENEPSQTGKITSSRKKKKKKRSKNPINSIHEDTAAPQEVNSIVISLNKSECYALMEDNTVSHKKEKKKKKK